jgi:hypothetical protein
MKFKILAIAVMVLGMIAAAAYAADITGKWVMEMPGMGGGDPMKIFYNFKVDGTTLTGTSGPEGTESPFSEGKINGNDISFTVAFGEMKMKMKGKVEGDQITLSMDMEGAPGGGPGGGGPGGGGPGGGGMPPMVLKRAK